MQRRNRRHFTPDFKAQLVLELLCGQRSSAELCRQHQLSASLLASWKQTVLEGLPTLFQGEERLSQEQSRIAELEQVLGRQTLELEILKKASRLLPGIVNKNGRS